MKLVAASLAVTFAGIAVFGFAAMGDHHDGCLAAAAQNGVCPGEANPFDFIAFHLNAIKKFSNGLVIFAGLLALAVGFWFVGITGRKIPAAFPFFQSRPVLAPTVTLSNQRIIFWLAQHENSPNLV